VAAERRAEGDAVVAPLRQPELDADDAVLKLVLREQVAPLPRLQTMQPSLIS
jgi:hypothetical protein